jgi:hypothetical protein
VLLGGGEAVRDRIDIRLRMKPGAVRLNKIARAAESGKPGARRRAEAGTHVHRGAVRGVQTSGQRGDPVLGGAINAHVPETRVRLEQKQSAVLLI